MSGIVRVSKRPERYTIADNEIIANSAMSWEARGVLIYLLSKPDNWTVRIDDLVKQSPAGIKVVRRIIKELEAFKYLYRHKYQGEGGKWNWESVVFDKPYAVPPDMGGIPIVSTMSIPSTPNGKTVGVPSTPNGKTVTVRPSRLDIVNTESINNTTTLTADQEKEVEEVYKLWQSNMTPLVPLLAEGLFEDYLEYGLDWIKYAVNESVANGVRNYKYFSTILQRVKVRGGTARPATRPNTKRAPKTKGGNAPVYNPDIFKQIQDQLSTGD